MFPVRAVTTCCSAMMLLACGARSGLDLPGAGATAITACTSVAPTCVVRPQWCEAPTTVAAVCDTTTLTWSCPAGSSVYRRSNPSVTCLPFSEDPRIASIDRWGLSGFTRLPTDDGRCLWIADSVTFPDDSVERNVAFEADPDLAFGECPTVSMIEPRSIVSLPEGADASALLVEINGGYRLAGATHVLYRVFLASKASSVGVVESFGGIATFYSPLMKFAVPAPSEVGRALPWGLDLDLGDAHYPAGDGTHELVWGCAREAGFLTEGCTVARVAADDSLELYSKAGDWIASVRASDGATQFDSGPWQSSVVQQQGEFKHLYVPEYGISITTQSAPSLLGPWSATGEYAGCDLPAGDSEAFCAGPIVHRDLMDPTRPNELPVTYGVGTTSDTSIGDVNGYWPRLVWLD